MPDHHYPRIAAYLREVKAAQLDEAERVLAESDGSPSLADRVNIHVHLDAAEDAARRLALLAGGDQ